MPSLKEKLSAARLDIFIALYHFLAMAVIGLSFFPAVGMLYGSWRAMAGHAAWMKVFVFSFLLGPAYFVFGVSLIFVSVFMKTVLGLRLRAGVYRTFSDWEVIRWIGYNSFVLIVNACFLDVLRISPLQNLFYRAMGARIGKGVRINTAGLADLSMIQIGDNSMIGGGVTLICHAAERGHLKLSPVKIGSGVSIGLGSIVMPGVEIGDGAVIAPRSLIAAGTVIPPRGHFGGDPLRDLRKERREEFHRSKNKPETERT